MKILICGVGAIGSNLVKFLVPDLKGTHEITVLDMDNVEERNVTPGTQWYSADQIGMPKVEAIQYNVYKWFEREIEIINKRFERQFMATTVPHDLVIDCFDNEEAREATQHNTPVKKLLHIGFSNKFTYAIEWAENYKVPTNIEGIDICEMPGAASFINSVASLGSLVVQEFLTNNKKLSFVGGKFSRTSID